MLKTTPDFALLFGPRWCIIFGRTLVATLRCLANCHDNNGLVFRFACFCLDSLVPGGRLAKAVRYTVAPLLFPVGGGGEFLMVIAAARDGRPLLFALAALWPSGFYSLMNQLIKQRRKFFATLTTTATVGTISTSAPKKKAAKRSRLSGLAIAASFSLEGLTCICSCSTV
jgi:hypothetical protein